jgi:hypothetical protein
VDLDSTCECAPFEYYIVSQLKKKLEHLSKTTVCPKNLGLCIDLFIIVIIYYLPGISVLPKVFLHNHPNTCQSGFQKPAIE